jgi:putative aldouronate transport system substrate-binding protein
VNSAAIVTPPGQLPIVREPITLTIGIQQSPFTNNYDTNYLTRYLVDKTGINLRFQLFAQTNADTNTQFELMVSANERLPDIMIHSGFPDWAFYGDSGVFIDLAPYFETQAYFYNQRIAKLDPTEADRIRINATAPSGKRYAWIMYSQQSTQDYRSANFINNSWLQKLGLKVPTTTEEFYNTLVAFRDRDPNGNGLRDEIPFIGGEVYNGEPFAFLINAFVYYPYREAGNWYLNATNGRLWTPFTTEEYREALRYINRLYNEGLMSPSTFTIKNMPELAAIVSYGRGDVGKVGFFAGHHNQVLVNDTPAVYDYGYQPPLIGPKGVNYYPKLPARTYAGAFITKDCQYPEAAFRWLDFIADKQTSTVARLGEEGVDWRWVRPEEQKYNYLGTLANLDVMNVVWGIPQNKVWNAEFAQMYIESENSLLTAWTDDGSFNAARYGIYRGIYVNDGKDVPERVEKINYTKDEEDSIREIRQTIDTYHKECLALFCTGAMSLDRDWNTYLSNLDRMGLQRYLQVAQTAYTRTIRK